VLYRRHPPVEFSTRDPRGQELRDVVKKYVEKKLKGEKRVLRRISQ